MLVTFAQAALAVVSVDKMSYNSSYISHYFGAHDALTQHPDSRHAQPTAPD